MSTIYDFLAPLYDTVNADIDYGAWADFIEGCIDKYGHRREGLVLDLACGTGSMTIELARRGYDMTGIDLSPEMLNVARERAAEAGVSDKTLWLCQDMTEFELYGTVDTVVCCLDSINHVTEAEDLRRVFALVHNYLSPDGIFIFDVNTKYKFESVYADNSYIIEEEGVLCAWQNYYDASKALCEFAISVFTEEESGRYRRDDEVQYERMYTTDTLRHTLEDCGFEYIGAFGDFRFFPPSDDCERLYIVAKAKK